ncbi:hypothetical protein M422DRAFT_251754 [Sphaerobolus stellatus SS14]|uniref:Uncharacterized protein n=1 Tax=Sphaerobolus stellatus (strain SS14) TaxID=990650 RepID=A0A0C9W1C4_SPHS4|nr:hypothetical protein M422DRAFT_251754 [Sphaerobolus stellatus SS14]
MDPLWTRRGCLWAGGINFLDASRFFLPSTSLLPTITINTTRHASHARRTREQILADRGGMDELLERQDDHDNRVVLKELALPTIVAQTQIRNTFITYLNMCIKRRPNYLTNYGYTTPEDVIKPKAPNHPSVSQATSFSMNSCLLSGLLCGFLDYMARVDQGQIDENITVTTLCNKVGLFIGMYKHLTGNILDNAITQNMITYTKGDCATRFKLSTRVRNKPTADGDDARLLQSQLWAWDDPIPSTRMHRQLSTFIYLACVSASRPGTIVESSGYANSNEALQYKVISSGEWHILPSRHIALDFSSPFRMAATLDGDEIVMCDLSGWQGEEYTLAIRTTYDLLKGKRKNKGEFIEFVMKLEAIEDTGLCAVTNLLLLALEDGIFEVIHNLNDLFLLMSKTPTSVSLRVKEDKLDLAPLRAYVPHIWSISPDRALEYDGLFYQLQRLALRTGFRVIFTPTCFRRMAANLIERSRLTTEQQSRYQSTLVYGDFQGIAIGKRQSLETVQEIGRLSLNADKMAPITLSVEGTKAIWDQPDITALFRMQGAA